MIHVLPHITAVTATSTTVELILNDDTGRGIRFVKVVGARGVEIPVEQPQGCPQTWHTTLTIDRFDLPFSVEGEDCGGLTTPAESNGPLVPPRPGDGGLGALPCSATFLECPTDCTTSTEESEGLWARLLGACQRCGDLRLQEAEAYLTAAGYAAAALVALIMAAVFAFLAAMAFASANIFLGVICVALAAAMLIGAITLAIQAGNEFARAAQLTSQREQCEASALELRRRFEDAQQAASSACPCAQCGPVHLQSPC